MTQHFIVAEISKNWPEPATVEVVWRDLRLLSERFEAVINTNTERGYALRDWQFSRLISRNASGYEAYNETIIAVFEWLGDGDPPEA